MKRNTIVLLLAAAAVLAAACKGREQRSADIITTDYEAPQLQAPIAMNTSVVSQELQWAGGRSYQLVISRSAVDSLPKVSDEQGQQYKDNKVVIAITRADGSTFFSRAFTKSTFANWLDGDYRAHGLLEDIHFFRADDDELLFTAAVNHPAASDDEAVLLRLAIDRQGDVTIGHYDENDRDDLTLDGEEP